jgi:hypothetical protein
MKTLKRQENEALYIGPQSKEPVNKDSIEAMEDRDRMVTGVFKNLEQPGQGAFIGFKLWKNTPYFGKRFYDGEIATIPLWVARCINGRTAYNKHAHAMDEKGNAVKTVGQSMQRYQFTSREFM